ncbi:MAG: hypothetical protein IIT46_13715 [Lachnospiraceae bacterium]|nr:hypothetical protein [Lachnospiraceae bacterium]
MNNKKQNYLFNSILVFVPLIAFVIWIIKCWSINYQVHDDRYMMEFLSGKFNGENDAHLVYIKYPLAIILKELYILFPHHDWYAASMIGIQFLMIAILSWCIISIFSKKVTRILALVGFYSVLILCWINEITKFTYSTVAAFVGVTIIVLYSWKNEKIVKYFLICALCFLAFNLRSDLFLMVLPVCGVLWIRKMIVDKEERKKQLLFLLGVVIVLMGSYICNFMAYSGDDWEKYIEYNKARTIVYDYAYEDLVVYEDNRDMYNRLNISENDCAILKSYDLYLCDNELIDKMGDIAKSYNNPRTLGKRFKDMIIFIIKDGLLESKMMTLVSGIFWLLAVSILAVKKRKKELWICGIFVLIQLVLWMYLGFNGRILPRVSHSMLLMQIVTPMIGLYIGLDESDNVLMKSNTWKIVSIGLVVAILCVSIYDVKLCKRLIWRNQVEADYQDQYIIENYCNSHQNNFYFLDVFSVVECKYIFDFHNENSYENFLSLGDWFSNSPHYKSKLEKEKISSVKDAVLHDENVYLIGIKDKNLDFIKSITDENVTIKEVDYLDGGMDDYVVYKVNVEDGLE